MVATAKLDFARWKRWLPRVGSMAAYCVALGLIGLGILIRFPLDAAARQPLPPFITLYPAIVLAAFVGGLRVGAFAVLVSALSAWFLWIGPAGSASVDFIRVFTLCVYLATASLTVITSGGARLLLEHVARGEEIRARSARESVHRIKNLLAIVQAISQRLSKGATDVPHYRDQLRRHLTSLAVAQDLLLKQEWGDLDLGDAVHATLGPFLPHAQLQIVESVAATLPSAAATGVSMALYELATNSVKYGALASEGGFVRVEWRCNEGRCALEWREVGLEHVSLGDEQGFGSMLIRSALNAVEGGVVHYSLTPRALSCLFEWPVNARDVSGADKG